MTRQEPKQPGEPAEGKTPKGPSAFWASIDRAGFQAVIDRMTEGLVLFDPKGNLLEMNPAALAIHGFDSVESLRRHVDELTEVFELCDLQGNALPTELWPVGRVLRGETFDAYEVRVRRLDTGRTWFASYGGAPVRDAEGQMQLALITLRDITPQKQMQRALSDARHELERRVHERTSELQKRTRQLRRLSSELTLAEQRERRRLAELLHDHLQQLLVGAGLQLEILARHADETGKQALERVNGLIDEAIRASRNLTMELSPPVLHEGGLAAGLEWLSRWMKDKHGLTVTLQKDPNANSHREDVRVLLFQSVRELLFNIVKHAGVREAAVDLDLVDDKHIRVTVRDDGKGFDPDRIAAGEEKAQTGFGLFNIQERLALLGGEMEIQSAPGRGSRFVLITPRERQREKAPAPRRAGRDRAGTVERAGSPKRPKRRDAIIRLLLVDDHEVMRQGLSALLEEEPEIEVVGEAADGVEALERARALQPDVILMDYSMPRMDGVEATRRVRQEMPHVQVVGLSMYEEPDRAAAMMGAGAVAYITKSGRADLLLQAIREAHAQALAAGDEKPSGGAR